MVAVDFIVFDERQRLKSAGLKEIQGGLGRFGVACLILFRLFDVALSGGLTQQYIAVPVKICLSYSPVNGGVGFDDAPTQWVVGKAQI